MFKTVFLLAFLSLAAAAEPAVVKSPARPVSKKSPAPLPKKINGVYFVGADGKRLPTIAVGTPFVIHFGRFSGLKLDETLAMILIYPAKERNREGPVEMSAIQAYRQEAVAKDALILEESGAYVGYLVDGLDSWSNPPSRYVRRFTFTVVTR